MKQINVYKYLIEKKEERRNLIERNLENDINKVCRDYIIMLRNNISQYENILSTTIMTLKYFDDDGYFIDDIDELGDALTNLFFKFVYCYVEQNYDFLTSNDIKYETKKETFIYSYIKNEVEKELLKLVKDYKHF